MIYFLQVALSFIILLFTSGSHEVEPASPSVENASSNTFSSSLWVERLVETAGIPEQALQLALYGFIELKGQNQLKNDSLIVIVDFSKPSVDKRLFIINLKKQEVVKNTLVAHGQNSGELIAESFSNTISSYQSSLGLYVTQNTYYGKHGYSLRLEGLSKGLNDNALRRAVVIHGANYVSDRFIAKNGRLGRSHGCPALPLEETQEIIDLIKDGTCLFIYHPSLVTKSPADWQKLN